MFAFLGVVREIGFTFSNFNGEQRCEVVSDCAELFVFTGVTRVGVSGMMDDAASRSEGRRQN